MTFDPPKTILILGGTAEAVALANDLIDQPENRIIYSLAGVTKNPTTLDVEVRVGGFGGVAGMSSYLAKEHVNEVVDATHPFALQISSNANKACTLAGIPIRNIVRPPWNPTLDDDWQSVDNLKAAAQSLPEGANAFLALGSKHLEEFYARKDVYFTVRMIETPKRPLSFSHHSLIISRPQASIQAEKTLFETLQISHLVCRNSGGKQGLIKLAAAQELGIKVIMIERPVI